MIQYDKKWINDPGFVFYDFNSPEEFDPDLRNTFDVVVIDPPFITHEVWQKYAITAKLLLKEGVNEDGIPNGKVIGTTVIENSSFLNEILNIQPTV